VTIRRIASRPTHIETSAKRLRGQPASHGLLCLCLACFSSIFILSTLPSPSYSSTLHSRRSATVQYCTTDHFNSTGSALIPPTYPISRIALPSRIPSRRTCPISATAHRVANHHRRDRPQSSTRRILRALDISGPSRPLPSRYGRSCNGPRAHLHNDAHAAWNA
jgi:hypothetical protein